MDPHHPKVFSDCGIPAKTSRIFEEPQKQAHIMISTLLSQLLSPCLKLAKHLTWTMSLKDQGEANASSSLSTPLMK